MEVDDLILDTGCNLTIKNGDLLVEKSDQQHIEHILRADLGHFRQYPLIGVGIEKYQNGSILITELKQIIRVQLESDNYNVRQIIITNEGEISIDAIRII